MNLKVRPGDIILVRGSTLIDRLIKAVTGSVYTHVAGVIKSDEVIDILPFTEAGYKSLYIYAGKADVFTCDTLTDKQRKNVVDYVRKRIGIKYDYALLVWEASRYMFHWDWPYKNSNSGICSTLWADAYRHAGVNLCPNISFPSPVDLAKSKILRKECSY